jgi:uncharacterized protein
MNALLCPLLLALALHQVEFPKRADDQVNDFAKVLSDAEQASVKQACTRLAERSGIPLVVCTVPSLEDFGAHDWTVQRYATSLYNDWGIGDKERNLGVLLFVAVEDRQLRIAVGDGHGVAFNGPAREIIERVIVPRFKKGDFGGGIVAGAEAIAERLGKEGATSAGRGQPAAPPPASGGEQGGWRQRGIGLLPNLGGGGMCLGIGFLVLLFSLLGGAGRSVRRRGGGGWGGFLMGGLLGGLATSMFSGRRGGGGFFGGGSSGGGFSSGGGGFSGGGGSFGGGFSSGGGASGSW